MSLLDHDVAEHAARLGVIEIVVLAVVEPSQHAEDLVAHAPGESRAHQSKSPVLLGKSACLKLWHKHLSRPDAAHEGSTGEPKGVPAGLSVDDSKLLTVGELIHVLFDVIGAL